MQLGRVIDGHHPVLGTPTGEIEVRRRHTQSCHRLRLRRTILSVLEENIGPPGVGAMRQRRRYTPLYAFREHAPFAPNAWIFPWFHPSATLSRPPVASDSHLPTIHGSSVTTFRRLRLRTAGIQRPGLPGKVASDLCAWCCEKFDRCWAFCRIPRCPRNCMPEERFPSRSMAVSKFHFDSIGFNNACGRECGHYNCGIELPHRIWKRRFSFGLGRPRRERSLKVLCERALA